MRSCSVRSRRLYRESPAQNSTVPVQAIARNPLPDDRDGCLEGNLQHRVQDQSATRSGLSITCRGVLVGRWQPVTYLAAVRANQRLVFALYAFAINLFHLDILCLLRGEFWPGLKRLLLADCCHPPGQFARCRRTPGGPLLRVSPAGGAGSSDLDSPLLNNGEDAQFCVDLVARRA